MSAAAPFLTLRRLAAFCVDFFPVMLVLDLFLPLSDAGVLAVASFILLVVSTALRGATPGKRLLGLSVYGTGCHACRELRRLWPLLALGLFALALEAAALRGAVPPSGFVLLCTLAGIVAMWMTHLWPLLRGEDLVHNRATGLSVGPRRS
ncbi:hypothetical protein C8N43_3588 [Litoreibacter ponti]|uniref:RDD family protein n=1 Tax=Litoreibacter ponti TaxID=1510457 RepID=A0A2T6BFD1_9RHOB|nr:hypothetical protein [Litoreibacter ponti]PTX54768.1 hypothetical protein C8N43_3588 [Litoreibacter ponti]